MASEPAYAKTPALGAGRVTLADTSRTAPANAVNILTAGPQGSRIERIVIMATGTTVASFLRLWLHDGTNYWLLEEIQVPQITPSAGSGPFYTTREAVNTPDRMPLLLAQGWSLRASSNDAQAGGINVIAIGGEF